MRSVWLSVYHSIIPIRGEGRNYYVDSLRDPQAGPNGGYKEGIGVSKLDEVLNQFW